MATGGGCGESSYLTGRQMRRCLATLRFSVWAKFTSAALVVKRSSLDRSAVDIEKYRVVARNYRIVVLATDDRWGKQEAIALLRGYPPIATIDYGIARIVGR